MIELHQYPAVWGLSSLSPFCIKVEDFLRRSGLPYRVVVEKNPARGPKGKMPFLRDGERVIADSTFILDYLVETYDLGHLRSAEPSQRAQGVAFQRLIEENLYFVLLYSRWIDPAGWTVVRREFASLFPLFLGRPVLALIRRSLRRQAREQGIGRHAPGDVYAIGRRDLQALSDFLGKEEYLLGGKYTTVDSSLYAFLVTILRQPIEGGLRRALAELPNLVAYAERRDAEFRTGEPLDEARHSSP